MENIYNNYRNIVERAVLAGIITEENKQFYLSAIDEENESDLSELECRLNMEETKNQSSHLKQKNDNFDPLLKSSGNEIDDDNIKESHTLHNKNFLADCYSLLSEDTIENNSILDLKYSKYKDGEAQETDSDTSLPMQTKKDSKSNHKLETARMLSKVMKKPIKNQFIDFDVPIYIDIKKKSLVKTHVADSRSSTLCDVSNTCCCKNDNERILGYEQSQNICKWTLPRTTLPEVKAENDIPPATTKNYVSSNNSCHPVAEISTETFQETDKSMKRKSVHTYSSQKGSSELYKKGTTIISKHQDDDDSILNQCHSRNGKQAINLLRRLKVPKNISTQEHKYRIRLKKPLNSVSHRQSFDAKTVAKPPLHIQRRAKICKHCECHNVTKSLKHTLNDNNPAETTSEDKASLPDIPSKRNIQDKDCDRFLNVNIICQFYPDSDEVQIVSGNQDPNNARIESDAQAENLKTEDLTKPATESCKTKQSKRIHRLSKIFANMKINRKQKEP